MGNTLSYTSEPHTISLSRPNTLITGTRYTSSSGHPKAIRYAGIPYAEPPLGKLRFRRPIPLRPDHAYSATVPFNAQSFHPPCPQKVFSAAEAIIGNDNAYSEDCLRLNIWVPIATDENSRPEKGWPVYVWLHGGWFQMGDPSQEPGMDPTELISEVETGGGGLRAIVVAVGYRLNVFGFLSGRVLEEEAREDGYGGGAGNYGLWDQRCALEWVRREIGGFGGDRERVTLAGRSAGSYAVQAQMMYAMRRQNEGREKEEGRLFNRVFMCSNAIPAQPKTIKETESQYAELLSALNISAELPGFAQLAALREVPASTLLSTIAKMENHTFRPVTDDQLILPGLVEYMTSGAFASDFKSWGCKLLIGEVLNEETLYATYNAPKESTLFALRTQIQNYYAPATTERILAHYSVPTSTELSDWTSVFGSIIADGQVRAPSRLLVDSLIAGGVPVEDIWRYQIAYRLSFIDDEIAPRSFGVSHAMDKPVWNYSVLYGPTEKERAMMKEWIRDLVAFVQAEDGFEYGTKVKEDMKILTAEGAIEVKLDPRWDELVQLGKVFCGK